MVLPRGLAAPIVIALLLTVAASVGAQSHNPKAPAALGPGINKGNVDNVGGPDYYYFYAGPGHIDLKFAFKEMGVFGNPLRESLTFDLYMDDGKLLSHNVVVSVEKMEQVSTSGTLDSRHKMTLWVTAPAGAIRLGGYYEIEVTGAVAFDGKAAGAGAKPQDTKLVTSGTSLTRPVGSLTTSGTSLSKPVGSLTQPAQALLVHETDRELRVTLAADVLFDFDKSVIRPDAAATLTLHRAAVLIHGKSRGVVRIEGYTDAKGAETYNLRLSDRRAASVKAWLVAKEAFGAGTLRAQGFGAAHPVALNTKADGSDDPAGRQLNRRVELIVSK